MLKLPRDFYDTIKGHAQEQAPREVCGLLAGEGNRVLALYKIRNVASNPVSNYQMDTEEQAHAVRTIFKSGLHPLAAYHSHPLADPEPSTGDIELAIPYLLYLIIGMRQGIVAKLWHIVEEEAVRVDLVLI